MSHQLMLYAKKKRVNKCYLAHPYACAITIGKIIFSGTPTMLDTLQNV